MAFDRFLIAPFNTGLQTDLRPWLIPEDAFASLRNAYVFRGRVKKRFGSVLMGVSQLNSRLRINLGMVSGAGSFGAIVPGDVFAVGQAFSIGGQLFTVITASNGGGPQPMLSTGPAPIATFDTDTGIVFIVAGVPGQAVYFYPGTPVMGITIYESGTYNNQPTYAFDTQFAYTFSTVTMGWERSGTGTTPEWHGTDLNFFWTTNWQGTTTSTTSPPVLFVTNFFVVNPNGAGNANDDPIWAFDGTTWTAISGANGFYFRPNGGAPHTGPFVKTARIIMVFKNRLLLLDTIENDGGGAGGTNTQYVNRLRFSAFASPFAPNAWYEPGQSDATANPLTGIAIGGDFLDAPTEEEIISAEFIKDRLIVFFQQSTWEVVYTGNEVEPFRWQKINTELGSQAQQSTVPFDKFILTMSNIGVHSCNGANVERIDEKIPDEVFEIKDKSLAIQRIAGIRDFFSECVYWSFPSDDENPAETYPNRVLLYNYRNDTWAINEDSITAFGFFEQSSDVTWADQTQTWEDSSQTWNSGLDIAQFRQVLAGNAEGFIFMIQRDITRNAAAMQLTNATYNSITQVLTLTIINHTLNAGEFGDYIYIENAQGATGLNGIYKIQSVVNANTVTVFNTTFSGTYTGGGTIARVSNPQILSKQWNPYVGQGRNFFLGRIDFGVLRTGDFGDGGQVTVDYYPSASELSMIQAGQATGAIMGSNILETTPYDPAIYPFESAQDRLWHPIYFQTTGECIQILIYMSDSQMTTVDSALADFELDGMVLHTSRSSARLQ